MPDNQERQNGDDESPLGEYINLAGPGHEDDSLEDYQDSFELFFFKIKIKKKLSLKIKKSRRVRKGRRPMSWKEKLGVVGAVASIVALGLYWFA